MDKNVRIPYPAGAAVTLHSIGQNCPDPAG